MTAEKIKEDKNEMKKTDKEESSLKKTSEKDDERKKMEEFENEEAEEKENSKEENKEANGNGNGNSYESETLEKTELNLKDMDENRVVNTEISGEMKRAYIDYAMSVIVSRALPSAEDGLKPVHRRILYAMEQMGLSKGPTKKSARIVGECFVRDTQILTTRGLSPIQKIGRGDFVYTHKGVQEVTELYEMPEKELLNVTLSNGISVKVTPSQKFKILNKSLEYVWKEAKDLNENDFIVIKADYPDFKENIKLKLFNNKYLELNENMAYLLGQFLSDGWIEKKTGRISFCSSSEEIINKIKFILETEFGYIANIETKNKNYQTNSGQLIQNQLSVIRINNRVLCNFLAITFNLVGKNAYTKEIPYQVLMSPKKTIYSFLSGLIDGDGSVHNKRNVIRYISISEKLIDKLLLITQQLGIIGKKILLKPLNSRLFNGRIVKSNYPVYHIEFGGAFSRRLAENLSLIDEAKKEKAIRIISSKIGKSNFEIIPFAGNLIFSELSEKHIGAGWYSDNDGKKFRLGIKYPAGCKIRYSKDLKEKELRRSQIIGWNILEKLKRINSVYYPILREFIDNRIFFIKVDKIEKSNMEKTYDFCVKDEHEFIANGIVSHNCMGKFHPHGDMAIYDALVRMAQDFSLRYPLIHGQGNFGCFTADTKIKLTDGRNLSFIDLINEHKNGKRNFTFTIDENKQIKIAEIKNPRKTKESTEIIKVILDNGEEIKCTPNHRFMLLDGSYKEAQYLESEDSLTPAYFRLSTKQDDANAIGYQMILQPKLNSWNFIHILSDNWNLENGIYQNSAGRVRHHLNFNKLNNNPDNIRRMHWKEHWQTHYNFTSEKHKTDAEYRKKLADGRNKFWNNPKNKEKYSDRLSERNKKNWKNEDYRQKMRITLSEVNKRYLKEHPEVIEEIRKTASITMKKMWKNPEYRKNKVDSLKQKWQEPEYYKAQSQHMKELSNKIWQNPEHKKAMSKLSKGRWENNSEYRNKMLVNLSEQGKKANYYRFLAVCKKAIELYGCINENNYEKAREVYNSRRGAGLIKFNVALNKFFSGDIVSLYKELQIPTNTINHKVVSVEKLNKFADVYDLTIDKTHNFALASGIFVHNSLDGDNAAASRYTEAKLSKLAVELLQDIDKNTVKFIPNFDNSLEEPIVLPGKLPNLLINGSSGIAVGMTTNIPPHNLNEICDAIIETIDKPKITVEELMEIIKGPDLPTGGVIVGNGLKELYETGRGSFVIRGKISEEEGKNRDIIIITEIPYQTNKSELVKQIAEMARDKKFPDISDIRDESSKGKVRIVIELKKGADPKFTINRLYKSTKLQSKFDAILVALVSGIPRTLNLKQLIEVYISYRRKIVRKRTEFDLKKAEDREHIVKGLLIALKNLEEVIALIKKSKAVLEASEALQRKFQLTKKQADAILEITLKQLTSLEHEKLKKEEKDLLEIIEKLKKILADEKEILKIIKDELRELKKNYGDERRSRIIKTIKEIEEKDLVQKQDVVITITDKGYIKRMPFKAYHEQRRGGKGVIGTELASDDFVKQLITCSTHDNLLLFTARGRIFWLKAYNVPEAQRYGKGQAVINLLNIKEDSITNVIAVKEFKDYLFIVTKKGIVKKIKMELFSKPRNAGVRIINLPLDNSDSVMDVKRVSAEQEVMIFTKKGQAIRFNSKEVREMGRASYGVTGIKLSANDEVVSMEIVPLDKKGTILTVTEKGYGKRSEIEDYRITGRACKGVINLKVSEKTGNVISTISVNDRDNFVVTTKKGIIIRTNVKNIRVMGRATQGVRIIKLHEGDKVVDIAKLEEAGEVVEVEGGNKEEGK